MTKNINKATDKVNDIIKGIMAPAEKTTARRKAAAEGERAITAKFWTGDAFASLGEAMMNGVAVPPSCAACKNHPGNGGEGVCMAKKRTKLTLVIGGGAVGFCENFEWANHGLGKLFDAVYYRNK